MAPNTYKRMTVDGSTKVYTRKGTQGRKARRRCVKVLVRVPVEYYELMKWEDERCGGNLSVTSQIQSAIRSSLCGCVYTQLLKH